MSKRLSIAVLLCVGIIARVSAGPAQDESLLGLWKSKHDCVVHIYIDDSGKPAAAAWGARKESAELTIKFSGERRFAWKRKTKKSGFGEDGEGLWPGEPSFLALGVSLDTAKSLGVEFHQNAIVWASEDATPQLILLR